MERINKKDYCLPQKTIMVMLLVYKIIILPWYKKHVPGEILNSVNFMLHPCHGLLKMSNSENGNNGWTTKPGTSPKSHRRYPFNRKSNAQNYKRNETVLLSSPAKLDAGSELLWIHKMNSKKKASHFSQSTKLRNSLR